MRIGVGSVDCAVTVRTARDIGLWIMGRAHLRDRMTTGAGARLIGQEQIVGRCAVGHMAIAAVLSYGRMLVDPRSSLGLVTSGALRSLRSELDLSRLVRSVTIGAAKHALSHRVMRRQIQPTRDLAVTSDTQTRITSSVGKNVPSHL